MAKSFEKWQTNPVYREIHEKSLKCSFLGHILPSPFKERENSMVKLSNL